MDLQKTQAKQHKWDNMADFYEEMGELHAYQGTITCAIMTDMPKAKRVLEVACGPGRHSMQLAMTMLRNDGGVLVSCDFSQKMINKLSNNYNSDPLGFSKIQGNKFLIDS
jgi:ubiquinone/menaquinone biosynthesis C-methylase UbiE